MEAVIQKLLFKNFITKLKIIHCPQNKINPKYIILIHKYNVQFMYRKSFNEKQYYVTRHLISLEK